MSLQIIADINKNSWNDTGVFFNQIYISDTQNIMLL